MTIGELYDGLYQNKVGRIQHLCKGRCTMHILTNFIDNKPFFGSVPEKKTLHDVFCGIVCSSAPLPLSHRLNMELDLQSLFELRCTTVLMG
jgi:hypothetical protein